MSLFADNLVQLVAAFDTPLTAAIAPGLFLGALLLAVLPWVSPDRVAARRILAAAAVALVLRYLWWRYAETLPPSSEVVNWLVGWAFLIVETIALLMGAVSLMFLTRVRDRSAEVDAHGAWIASRDKPPMIDVLICTYNEEQRLVERTIVGAMAMKYPAFRTWVLDDGRRPWLRNLCQTLGCGYIARPSNEHGKAGNLNHGLQAIATLPEQAEFIAILDADFVPTDMFLARSMALFHDPAVGIVQTPQHFINPDPIQTNLDIIGAWPDEQRYFFDIVMPGKDAWGAAFCCGTSSIVRAEALTALGGVPTDSVTEDYLLSVRLREIGYATAYLNEPLSFGLAPEGLKEYTTQRGRWCLGFMQIVRGPSGPFSRRRGIRFIDRVAMIEGLANWSFVYLYRFAGILVPIVYLLFGIKAVEVSLTQMLAIFLPYFAVYSLTMSWISRGRVVPIMTDVCQLLTAPSALKATAIGLLRPQGQKFKVTAKGGNRGARFVEWPLFRIFATLLVLAIASVMVFFMATDHPVSLDSAALALAWTWYNIAALSLLCLICIEQPRRRRAGRFPLDELTTIVADGRRLGFNMRDISASGARFDGTAPVALGETLLVRIGSEPVPARLVRVAGDGFSVRFSNSLPARASVIRYIYSGSRQRTIPHVHAAPIAHALLRRIFR